jgi:hypothetical protein
MLGPIPKHMTDIFKIIAREDRERGGKKGVRLGIEVRVGDWETVCPVSDVCQSLQEMTAEIEAVKKGLDRALQEAKKYLEGTSLEGHPAITPEMSPEAIWSVLDHIEEEDLFTEAFNGLEDATRRAVAEHVLTRCNIFSGKASLFSARYDSESGRME